MSDVIVEERNGTVLVITINRPSVRNAVNLAVARGIAEALDRLDNDDALRVGVVTGAGGTFSAGMDLNSLKTGEAPKVPGRGFAGIVERSAAKPLIAAVEGYAFGGGFEIALACDLIVATTASQFALPEVRRGLVARAGGLLRLGERIPRHLASELVFTGQPMSGERANEMGLLNRLVAPGEALAAAIELAEQIAANAPLSVQTSKRIMSEARDWPTAELFQRQAALADPVFSSADAREGAEAFKAKRLPVWSGR